MNEELKKIKSVIEKIRMSDTDKSRVRNFLSLYISKGPILSPFSVLSFFKKGKVIAGILIVLVAVSAAGTSFAADQSLPGDPLYPVKVNVNEQLESFVTFGTDAKAQLALTQARTRLQEAEELSIQGKLNPETQQIILSNFNKSAAALKVQTSVLASSNNSAAVDLSNQLQTSVKAHAKILEAVAGNNPAQRASVNTLVHNVEHQVGTSSASASSTQLSGTSTLAAKNKMNEAQGQIDTITTFISSSNLPLGVTQKATLSLEAAADYLAGGQLVLENIDVTSSSTSTVYLHLSKKAKDALVKNKLDEKTVAENKAISLFTQAETSAAEARVLAELYINGGLNAEQVINSIPNSLLNASSTEIDALLSPVSPVNATSTFTATSTALIATSTSSSTIADTTSSSSTSTSTNASSSLSLDVHI